LLFHLTEGFEGRGSTLLKRQGQRKSKVPEEFTELFCSSDRGLIKKGNHLRSREKVKGKKNLLPDMLKERCYHAAEGARLRTLSVRYGEGGDFIKKRVHSMPRDSPPWRERKILGGGGPNEREELQERGGLVKSSLFRASQGKKKKNKRGGQDI